jgi:hypothetical protein
MLNMRTGYGSEMNEKISNLDIIPEDFQFNSIAFWAKLEDALARNTPSRLNTISSIKIGTLIFLFLLFQILLTSCRNN